MDEFATLDGWVLAYHMSWVTTARRRVETKYGSHQRKTASSIADAVASFAAIVN